MSNSQSNKTTDKFSEDATKATIKAVNEQLAKIAGSTMKQNDLFRDRKDAEQYVEKPKTMSLENLVNHASKIIKADSEVVEFTKVFKARPNDGAVAFAQVLTDTYGFGAIGKTTYDFFGNANRPEYKTVTTGFLRNDDGSTTETTVEVPWGLMEFGPLDAKFNLWYTLDVDYGFCFQVSVEAPKKMQGAITGLFTLVERYLRQNSIYRNKALYGVGRANPRTGEIVEPEFVNVYNTDRNKIVYTEQISRELEYSIFGVIRNADALRNAGKSIGKKVLLWGPNGSGKTEAATAAMQIALENGWTAIRARYDEDIAKVIKFAESVGTPTVVIVEDCEKLMVPANADHQEMDKMLDLFDGAGAKGREVLLVMTSNHVHELTKSMLRPGRINRLINVANLDREAFERLFNILVTPERLDNVDFDALFSVFPEVAPVWVVEAINRAEESVIIRTGEPGAKFVTDDFLYEAQGMSGHLDLHMSATDRPVKEAFGTVFADVIKEAVEEILPTYQIGQDRGLEINKVTVS